MINRKIRVIINGLAQAGLNSSQTSNDDLRTILDNFLNGGVRTEVGTVVLEGWVSLKVKLHQRVYSLIQVILI